mmetsp:Transcript_34685/g.92917  ORF Transcript_34685/g.92917 Transcript_34685/m.92917 type:complete len:150 (-) Transcript_34685:106-555(-)
MPWVTPRSSLAAFGSPAPERVVADCDLGLLADEGDVGLALPTAVGGGCRRRAPPSGSTGRAPPASQRESLSSAECSDCCEPRPTAMSRTLLVKCVKLATLKMELRLEPAEMLLQALPRRLLPRRPGPSKNGAPVSRPRLLRQPGVQLGA